MGGPGDLLNSTAGLPRAFCASLRFLRFGFTGHCCGQVNCVGAMLALTGATYRKGWSPDRGQDCLQLCCPAAPAAPALPVLCLATAIAILLIWLWMLKYEIFQIVTKILNTESSRDDHRVKVTDLSPAARVARSSGLFHSPHSCLNWLSHLEHTVQWTEVLKTFPFADSRCWPHILAG